ncbi:hypothetical protein [uncultured Gammaproteobacteria bacterium]|nr:hypothetical protein [uncultured Gammaproteobacteria bacterium]
MKKIGIIILITVLSGCGGNTLECNDSTAKEAVLNIILSHVAKARWGREMMPNVSDTVIYNIKTLSYDEELDTYMCASKYSFNYKGNEYSKDIQYKLSYLEDIKDTEVAVFDIKAIKSKMMVAAMYR